MPVLKKIDLLTAPHKLTAIWSNLGPEIQLSGEECLKLWVDITINDSTGIQFKLVGLEQSGGAEFEHALEMESGGIISVTPKILELANNTDQRIIFCMVFGKVNMPFVRIKTQAKVLGTNPASITTAYATII